MASRGYRQRAVSIVVGIGLLLPAGSLASAVEPGDNSPSLRLAASESLSTSPEFRGTVNIDELLRQAESLTPRASSEAFARERQFDRVPSLPIGTAGTGAPPPDLATLGPTSPATMTKFGGSAGQPADSLDGPNPIVAVGPDHVVQASSAGMRITNRNGANPVLIPFSTFFDRPTRIPGRSERIYFDSGRNRWIAIETNWECNPVLPGDVGRGFLTFAISEHANPRKGWAIWRYEYTDVVPADPGFGNSSDKFILTNNLHTLQEGCVIDDSYTDGSELRVFDWADYVGGTFNGQLFPLTVEEHPEFDFFRLLPAVQSPAATDVVHLAVETADVSIPAEHHIWHMIVSGAIPAAEIHAWDLSDADNIVPGWTGVPSVSGVFMGYGPSSVAWRNNRLVVASGESCTPAGDSTPRSCARITDLDTSTVPASRRQDFYLAANGQETYSPGVVLSGTGDLFVAYNRSPANSFVPSSYVVRQRSGDAPATISAARVILGGIDPYNGGRWIDTVGLAGDPLVDDSVWVTHAASIDGWQSRVAQLTTATGDTYVPITPLRVLDTRTTPRNIEDFFWDGIPKTIEVAGEGTIPLNAVAITGNLTVVMQSRGGYVSVGPSVSANPTTSTINFPANEDRANNLTLPLNADGDLQAVFKGGAGNATGLILDVTGYFLADDSGATYEPITAFRVLDTRVGTGLSGKFVFNSPRTFQVTGVGGGGVPDGATAVTGNLTVVGQTRRGFVSLTPTPDADPDTSTINFPLGDNRANGVTVQLSPTGSLSAVYKASGGSTDMIFDVTGYYVDDLSGLRFYPLNPGRIMDTRFNTLTQLFGPFSNSVPRTLVTGGHFGVPATALAVTGNLTVVGPTKAGYVSITKNPDARPPVSAINFPFGDIRANGVTVPLNTANDMALVYKGSSGARTHLILDLTGYFK